MRNAVSDAYVLAMQFSDRKPHDDKELRSVILAAVSDYLDTTAIPTSHLDEDHWTAFVEEIDKRTQPSTNGMRNIRVDTAHNKLAEEMKVFSAVVNELRSELRPELLATVAQKRQFAVYFATDIFGVAPTWTSFYRETFGGDGILRTLFSGEELRGFEGSEEHATLLEMLTVLRSRDLPESDLSEPQRMISVRIPKSLHDAICNEANSLDVSVNKLCISKLLQKIDLSLIPTSSQKRRGRRPLQIPKPKDGQDEVS